MKKFAALLLAGAMAFSMMACGSSSDKKAGDKSSDSKRQSLQRARQRQISKSE